MKEQNLYEFHSVYLKNKIGETHEWERIEGVIDAQARLSQKTLLKPKSKENFMNLKFGNLSDSKGIPGAVRRIVRFFK